MDAKTNKIRVGTIIARLKCWIEGHDRTQHRDFYGFLTNGEPIYVQRYDKCIRCGK
jgi:hypothetical protein